MKNKEKDGGSKYKTQEFRFVDKNKNHEMILKSVKKIYDALIDKDYDPVNQMVGYVMSGDPGYITSYKDARDIISKFENNDLLEEFIRFYFEYNKF
ncbi:MAG: IreB family regulatory phosphoprotein [Clostridiales bacterium]|jgi:uncharacterized protein (UPF0297 family)|nr:IreB family regulatory phosphoprotein [Clostridiales bacterium]